MNRLGHIKPVAGANVIAADVVPAAELLNGDTEAIGDGNESVSTANAIEGCATRSVARCGGNNDSLDSAEIGS